MARESNRQDRNPRPATNTQTAGARATSGERAGRAATGSGERQQPVRSGQQTGSKDRERTVERGGQAGSSEREQTIQSGRETGSRQSQSPTGVTQRGGTSTVRGPGAGGVSAMGSSGNPFLLMQRMAEDMDSLFEQFGFGRTGFGASPAFGSMLVPQTSRGASRSGRVEQSLWSPQIEVRRRGDNLVIRADLPGVGKDDVHVEVENDVLTIRGERREEHEEEGEGFYRSERSYGTFHRVLPLPDGVDADQCEATFRDGVLEITLPAPKPQEQRAKRIEVR